MRQTLVGDDQVVSESSTSAGFPQISLCSLKKCSKKRTMSKKPLRLLRPNMLRPAAVHKSQHHSSIAASRQRQNLVSLVSDSERYVHCTPQQVVKIEEFLEIQYEISKDQIFS